jgi:hypothetical protein
LFFFSQSSVQGVGTEAVEQLAVFELGLSEGGVLIGDVLLGHLTEEGLGARAEGFNELTGLGLLFFAEWLLHGSFSDG